MTDNYTQLDPRDRIQGHERSSYELSFMKKKYGVSHNDVIETIELVGRNRAKVEDRLRQLSRKQQ